MKKKLNRMASQNVGLRWITKENLEQRTMIKTGKENDRIIEKKTG
jgi:hypothetical protein